MSTSATDFSVLFLANIMGKPIAIIGKAKEEILILKPKKAINQAVTVVPILAPIITPIDSTRLSNPALAKLTTITVVAEDDWINNVIKKPVNTPRKRFLVILLNIWRSLFPAAFCIPSLMIFIPKMKKPKAPSRFNDSNSPKSIFVFL